MAADYLSLKDPHIERFEKYVTQRIGTAHRLGPGAGSPTTQA